MCDCMVVGHLISVIVRVFQNFCIAFRKLKYSDPGGNDLQFFVLTVGKEFAVFINSFYPHGFTLIEKSEQWFSLGLIMCVVHHCQADKVQVKYDIFGRIIIFKHFDCKLPCLFHRFFALLIIPLPKGRTCVQHKGKDGQISIVFASNNLNHPI